MEEVPIAKYGILDLDSFIHGEVNHNGSQWWKDLLGCCEVGRDVTREGWFQSNIVRALVMERSFVFYNMGSE